jgi:ornithine carbamoyltransferase
MNPDPQNAIDPMREPRTTLAVAALAQRAQQLRTAATAGGVPQALKDRNLALLCEDPSLSAPLEIYRAAVDLGARVSLVRPRFDALDPATTASTARMLGRLYDGVVCIGLPGELVQALRDAADVPVLDDGVAAQVLRAAAAEPAGGGDVRFLWQAALSGGLA